MKEKTNIFSNERVSASAGSGKTHSLTSRFIALSEHERNSENAPDPTGIIALTFTKKSAGEFLRKILTRLSDAIENENKLKELSDSIYEISEKNIDKKLAQSILEESLKNIDKLKLSTIDAFFGSVLKVFTNELGIFTPMQIIDGQAQADLQKNIVENILENTDFSNKDFKNFIEIIKKSSFSSKDFLSLNESLQKAVLSALYLKDSLSKKMTFGDISTLQSRPLLAWDTKAYLAEVQALEPLLFSLGLGEKDVKGLIAKLENSNDKEVDLGSAFLGSFAEAFAENEVLSSLKFRRATYEISPELFSLMNSILRRLFDAHIARYFSASKEISKFLEKYENLYFREMTSKGMLTFADVPKLLNSCEKAKELLEFRLDVSFKHWLFDEFQDTSRSQWQFFSGIVDRILNPQEGDSFDKTFYYVGDLKQSIYSWRGGDKELFKEIFEQNKEGVLRPIKPAKALTKSYRSHANIIKIVNEIFNKQDVYSKYLKDVFEETPSEEFLDIFDEHSYNKKNSESTSLAQLKFIKESPEDSDFYEHIYDILKELIPTGKSIGILVNKNDEIKAICDFLSAKGVKVAPEGTKQLAQNNMLASAFVQLLKYISYPDDSASFEYLKMTPFRENIEAEDFISKSLSSLSTAKYLDFFKAQCANLKFYKSKDFEELLQALNDFENSKKRGIDKLITFLETKEIALSSNANFVQVMTIHKSKGLEFSVVILPHLESISSVKFGGLQVIEKNGKSTISYMPTEDIISLNKSLKETKLRHKNNAMFENICKFYVALTRAENALYVVLNSKKRGAGKIASLLSEAFFRAKTEDVTEGENLDIYNIGNPKWYESLAQKEAEESKTKAIEQEEDVQKVIEIKRVQAPALIEAFPETLSPSKASKSDEKLDAKALAFGTAIHKILEQIKFMESDVETSILEAISLSGIENTLSEVILNILKKFFANSEIKALFEKAENLEVFNEFDFTSELSGEIVLGQIDRLMLEKDNSGKVIFAKIIDYKSSYSEKQNAQLCLYKNVIKNLYALDENQISLQVLSYSKSSITLL